MSYLSPLTKDKQNSLLQGLGAWALLFLLGVQRNFGVDDLPVNRDGFGELKKLLALLLASQPSQVELSASKHCVNVGLVLQGQIQSPGDGYLRRA
jgi:hypothetical protein